MRNSESGFTLVEIMITVVILGILAAIAYPSYTSYVALTRRTDGTMALTRIAAIQEKFYTECGTYTTAFNGAISDPNPANRCTGLGIGATAASYTTLDGFYTITAVITAGGGGFTLTAQPTGVQSTADSAKCNTITVNQAGVKSALGTDGISGPNGGKCWKK